MLDGSMHYYYDQPLWATVIGCGLYCWLSFDPTEWFTRVNKEEVALIKCSLFPQEIFTICLEIKCVLSHLFYFKWFSMNFYINLAIDKYIRRRMLMSTSPSWEFKLGPLQQLVSSKKPPRNASQKCFRKVLVAQRPMWWSMFRVKQLKTSDTSVR